MANYRQTSVSFGPPISRMVKYLVIFTSATFLLYLLAKIFRLGEPDYYFALIPFAVTHFVPLVQGVRVPFFWQPVTYLFLHAGWFHIIFNLYALWIFGSDLERLWGPRQFLVYFFLTGIGAGLFNVLLEHNSMIPTVGNSGAVYGLLLAYGMIFPDRIILFSMIIPMKAKWFVVLMGLIEFISSLSGPGTGVAHLAHLGGMLFGFLYLRGNRLPYRVQLKYHEWRRARLRRKFEIYMNEQDKKKDQRGPWVN